MKNAIERLLSALTVREVFHFDPVHDLFGETMDERIALGAFQMG